MPVVIKGLADGVINAVKDWIETRLKAIDNFLRTGSLLSLAKDANEALPGRAEMSGTEVVNAPGAIIKTIAEALDKNKIPMFLAAPIIALISVAAGLRTLLLIAETTTEKNILQPLRETIRPNLLSLGDVIEAERRGFIDAETAKKSLGKLGYSNDQIEAARKLAKATPQVQDIIRFAVREVYSPSAGSLGIFDEADESFINAAEKDLEAAGISKELARKFWGAHWTLPSPQMGFEMLHRGLINREQLAELLKASDFPKVWRDRLTAIAFTPLTRVDVRRMHKLGVLDRAGVKKAFMDIGYDDANAELLTRFTEKYNKDPEEAEKTDADRARIKERDLTKSDIVSAFSNGTIDAAKAKSFLTALQYSAEEIDILIGRVQFQREKQVRDKLIDAFHDLFLKGLFSREDANEALEAIPLSANEIKELFKIWDVEKLKTADVPTKADILRWAKKDFISKGEAKELLLSIGTQERFADFYIKEL